MKGCIVGVAIALLTASAAAAEPIQITSGFANFYWDSSLTGFQLVGRDTELASEFRGVPLPTVFHGGELVNISNGAPASNQGFVPLSQRVEGTLYPAVWLSGGISLMVDPFVAPHTSQNGFMTFSQPFTMTGQINGFANRDLTGPLFSVAVTGGGTTSVTYRTFENDTYLLPNFGGQSFVFSAQPAETPEPATLLLMATGVAGVIARKLRRPRPGNPARASE